MTATAAIIGAGEDVLISAPGIQTMPQTQQFKNDTWARAYLYTDLLDSAEQIPFDWET